MFHVPGLGVTMADGGEELREERRAVAAMTCPFLKEAQVKYCRTSSVRKLIPLAEAGRADEKCSSADIRHLPGVSHAIRKTASGPCPYLGESLMQYCGAAPVAENGAVQRVAAFALRQRRYPLLRTVPFAWRIPAMAAEEVDGIALPEWLQLLRQPHVARRDRRRHVPRRNRRVPEPRAGQDRPHQLRLAERAAPPSRGADGGRRRSGGRVSQSVPADQLQPVPARRPVAPHRPSRTPADGCSKACRAPETTENLLGEERPRAMDGAGAAAHERVSPAAAAPRALAADGGLFAAGVARMLDRDRKLALFHEFFSPYASGRESREDSRKNPVSGRSAGRPGRGLGRLSACHLSEPAAAGGLQPQGPRR